MEISNANYQAMSALPLEEILVSCPNPRQHHHQNQNQLEKKPRPHPDQALKCPRCDSTNTKFCYYNNYSLSQPRYFCKGCRRYWTKGGTLRNIPVGGCSRKNKKFPSSSSNSSSSSNLKKIQDNINSNSTNHPPLLLCSDPNYDRLNSALARIGGNSLMVGNPNPNPNNHGFFDVLRNGLVETSYSNGLVHGFYGFGVPQDQVFDVNGGFSGGAINTTAATTVTTTTAAAAANNNNNNNNDDVSEGLSGKGFEGEERKGLIAFNQWQLGREGNIGMEYGKEYNMNAIGSSHHGFMNNFMI